MVALELHPGKVLSTCRPKVGRPPSLALHRSNFSLSSSALEPHTRRSITLRCSAGSTSLDPPPLPQALPAAFETSWEEANHHRVPIAPETLDEWMRGSIGEIVRNIGEGAPFLVHIFYNKSSSGPSTIRLEREVASADSWPSIKSRWREDNCTPDGVILVEALDEDDRGGTGVQHMREDAPSTTTATATNSSSILSRGSDARRTWGLVVQCRGMDGAACYLLSTTRVRSSGGFCTHFCLVKAKCFGEPAEVQLKKAWLLGV